MKKILGVLALMTTLSSSPEQASGAINSSKGLEKVFKPVAMVDDVVVTEDDVQQTINIMRVSGVDITKKDALERVINEIVLITSAPDDKIYDSERIIGRLAESNGIEVKAFLKKLDSEGIKKESLQRHLKAQLAFNELVQKELEKQSYETKDLYKKALITKKNMEMSDEAVRKQSLVYKFKPSSKVKIAEMKVDQNIKDLEKLMQLLHSKIEFSEIKKQFYNHVELEGQDGLVGWLSFGELSDLYKETVSSCIVGNVCKPLVAGSQLLFIKLLAIKDVTTLSSSVNKEYLKMPYDEKCEKKLSDLQMKLISESLIINLKRRLFIEIL